MALIQFNNIHKKYPMGDIWVNALNGVTLTIEEKSTVAISGSSGSGKSTLLNMIGCIDQPTSGEIILFGQPCGNMSDKQITRLRHENIGFIFQSFNLLPVLNVYENIEFPLLMASASFKKQSKAERRDWIMHLIHAVGLSTRITNRPNQLSGGQRQRVAIARALATKPKILLADEPTANLDSKTSEQILALLQDMNQNHDTTLVFSTHDERVVEFADHIMKMEDGQLITNQPQPVLKRA